MKNYSQLCKTIEWEKMAKARITVKNLAQKKPTLKYLANFLDALAESAVEVHNVKLNQVYPSAGVAGLIKKARDQEAVEKYLNDFSKFKKEQNGN